MKIKTKDLLEALEIVKPGLATKEQIAQTTAFAFMGDRIVTYNDEISISHPVEGLEIKGAIQAEELYSLLKKITKDEIDITLSANEIILKSGRIETGFTLHQEIKLPLDEIDVIGTWQKVPSGFLKGLKFVIPCCSKDMSNPVLTCVHINEAGFIEASDGFRLVQYALKDAEMPTFLIPAMSAIEVLKLEPSELSKTNSWVHFRSEFGTIISCRIFTDKFPNTTPHFKVKGEKITFPTSLPEVLNRAVVFSKRDHFIDENVDIDIIEDKIKVSSKSDSGWFKEILNIKYDNTPLAFSVAPQLLLGILSETSEGTIGEKSLKFQNEDWQYISMLKAPKIKIK